MHRKVFLTLAALCCLASIARADLSIIVGSHILQPNMANQPIQIFVTGGDNVAGMDFVAQVGDGGPTNAFSGPGVIAGPNITADVVTGTIFATNHNPPGDPAGGSEGTQTVFQAITTVSGTVTAAGLIGTIFVDTTGWGPGFLHNPSDNSLTWELNMGGGQGPSDAAGFMPAATDFPPIVVGSGLTILDGSITIVPEPSSVVMGLFAAAGLGFVAIRKRRARRA